MRDTRIQQLLDYDIFAQKIEWRLTRTRAKMGSMPGLCCTVAVFVIFIYYFILRAQAMVFYGSSVITVVDKPQKLPVGSTMEF